MSPRHVMAVGAGGFIGRRVVGRLLADGHRVTCAGRDAAALCRLFPACRAVEADLGTDDAERWAPRLDGVDAVVNAAGILRGDLDGVQRRGPMALFDACAYLGVLRVVQVSALGPASWTRRSCAPRRRPTRTCSGWPSRRAASGASSTRRW